MPAYQCIAEIYDAIRPGYPAALIHDIITAGNLNSKSALMEIGAGTGKATEAFLSLGCSIDAVEIEASMAELLHKKLACPKLSLTVSPFEDWTPPRTQYDCIYCGQAFHWLGQNVKFRKCWQYLPPKGLLVLFWYDPMPPEQTAAYQAAQQIKLKYIGSDDVTTSVSMDTRLTEIQETKEFELLDRKEYRIVLKNSAEQAWVAMESTPAFQDKLRSCRKRNSGHLEMNIGKQLRIMGAVWKHRCFIHCTY